MAGVVFRVLQSRGARVKGSQYVRSKPKAARERESIRKLPVRWNIPKSARRRVEQVFVEQFGKHPKGTTWTSLAMRYPERFQEYFEAAMEDQE
jgi:hypothetical protein